MAKQDYTKKEVELIREALYTYDKYLHAKGNYFMVKFNVSDKKSLKAVKKDLDKSVEECEKNIPKSLINKLEIKKIG